MRSYELYMWASFPLFPSLCLAGARCYSRKFVPPCFATLRRFLANSCLRPGGSSGVTLQFGAMKPPAVCRTWKCSATCHYFARTVPEFTIEQPSAYGL